MAAVIESIIVVALALLAIGYFIHTQMTGGSHTIALLSVAGLLAVWGYGIARAG